MDEMREVKTVAPASRRLSREPALSLPKGRLARRVGPPYSVNTTDCNPEISKRLRQRRFLHANMSSLRSI
jgi:hypothetical protein